MNVDEIAESIYVRLEEIQGGRCGICGSDKQDLVRDHDHGSGFVRGLLCGPCNTREGQHGHGCQEVRTCQYCTWRRTPAVAWLGYTVTQDPPDTFFDHPGFAPAVVRVEQANANRVRAARAAAAVLNPEGSAA